MLNKIYLIALAVFLVLMLVLTYIAGDWFSSVDDPRRVVENFEYYSRLSANFLWISALILLILANVLLWQTRKAWAFWATFLYFAFFLILHTFWLNRSFVEYKRTNGMLASSISLTPLLGVGLCLAAGFIVFFNQFLVLRMRDKMFPQEQPVEALPEDAAEKIEEEKAE
jgi:heme/copper-type cytochrome/quinol oxidase subunit 2